MEKRLSLHWFAQFGLERVAACEERNNPDHRSEVPLLPGASLPLRPAPCHCTAPLRRRFLAAALPCRCAGAGCGPKWPMCQPVQM